MEASTMGSAAQHDRKQSRNSQEKISQLLYILDVTKILPRVAPGAAVIMWLNLNRSDVRVIFQCRVCATRVFEQKRAHLTHMQSE